MRRGLIRHIALLFLLLTALTAQAQRNKRTVVVDTVQVAFINGIMVHVDLLGAYQARFTDRGQYEAGLRVNLKDRYFPAAEVGYGMSDEKMEYTPDLKFKTKAPYFRVGCDFNILNNKHDDYKLFGGFRYGHSAFDYDMTVSNKAAEGEEEPETPFSEYTGLHCNYHWLEGVFGVDAKIWGPLHMGWDVRYRRRLIQKCSDVGEPWYVPGYGGKKAAGFGVTFNLTVGF